MHCTPARPGAPFPAPMLTTTRASTLSLLGHMACRTEKPFPSSLEATGVSFFACTVLENPELVFNSPLCLRQTFCVCPECVDQQSSLNQLSAEQSNGCHEAQSYNPLIAPAALANGYVLQPVTKFMTYGQGADVRYSSCGSLQLVDQQRSPAKSKLLLLIAHNANVSVVVHPYVGVCMIIYDYVLVS